VPLPNPIKICWLQITGHRILQRDQWFWWFGAESRSISIRFPSRFFYILEPHTRQFNLSHFWRQLDQNWAEANAFFTSRTFFTPKLIIVLSCTRIYLNTPGRYCIVSISYPYILFIFRWSLQSRIISVFSWIYSKFNFSYHILASTNSEVSFGRKWLQIAEGFAARYIRF
jgi:hypothetical protein